MTQRMMVIGLAVLAIVLCETAKASTTITLQQGLNGYAGTTDAWLDRSQNRDNWGGANYVRVQWYNGRDDCTVVKFDLTGQIPPNQRILSATLSFYYYQAGSMQNDNAMTIKPFRFTPEAWWDENIYGGQFGTGVSYRYRDIYEQYEWAGGAEGGWWDKIDDSNGVNKIKKDGGTPPDAIPPLNWVPFDVAPSVRQWYNGATNNGFLVVATGFEGGGTTIYGLFFSSEEGGSAYRPVLTITYEGALPPTAEADGPYAVGPGQSVLFDGRASYDPDGGLLTAWLWDLDGDGLYDDGHGAQLAKTYDELLALGLTPGDHTIGIIVRDDENEWSLPDTARLTILSELDFGDAPDLPYQTLLLSNGARHVVVPGVFLGAGIDSELDGWQDPAALGDDDHGIDDEDGVSFSTLRVGQPATVSVTASVAGMVSAWLDFDDNGSWAETDNLIVNNIFIPNGTTILNFTVPSAAVAGTTFARVRFSIDGGLTYFGEAPNGEVEDYQVTIEPEVLADLGDAPDSTNSFGLPMTAYPAAGIMAHFPTVYRAGSPPFGPIHKRPDAVAFLGSDVTFEEEADAGTDEDPQNNIVPPLDRPNQDGADDGVPVPLTLPHCQETTFDYVVTLTLTTISPQLFVNVWFDWNRDGDWDDDLLCPLNQHAPEWAVQNQALLFPGPGQYTVTTPSFRPWHPTDPPQEVWTRITLSEDAWQPQPVPGYGGSGPEEGYWYGETEDYYFIPRVPQETEACCFDTGECRNLARIECESLGATPQGLGTQCTGTLQACCLDDGNCVMVDPICCDDLGGVAQGAGSACTEPQGCCLPEGICLMVDPLCCDDLGGVAQGQGTYCVEHTIPCCLDDGTCRDVDPLCCDDLGGVPGYGPICLGDLNGNNIDDACEPPPPPVLEPKWLQPPHYGGQGFDAISDLWWSEQPPKWEQLPDASLPGVEAHDGEVGPMIVRTTLADDWICGGGDVVSVAWWGNYVLDGTGQEMRGAGINRFHLSVHRCAGGMPYCLPLDPEFFGFDVPFPALIEHDTGLVNVEGSRIYRYEYVLPMPVPQIPQMHYWFDITAYSSDTANPTRWRWQEANRSLITYLGWAPAARKNQPPFPGLWETIIWPTDQLSDFAFRLVSRISGPSIEVNRVTADDFISDGRVIKALDWWGSYWDEQYAPVPPPIEPYILDGWLVSFHHAEPLQVCPPDASAADIPTVLGVYFAPVDAVQINPLDMADCFGHTVYQYNIDLSRCCLLCSESDPRLPDMPPPARPDGFHEVSGMRYWLGIQAVVGVEWLPTATMECEKHLTGHLPSPSTADGHFWGWHTSAAAFMPQGPLAEACAGRILDFTPQGPDCWEYGGWQKQLWLCDTMPPYHTDAAFGLLALACDPMGDVNADGVLDVADIACFVECLVMDYSIGCVCGCADMNHDYLANGLDIQLFVDALLTP